VQNWLSLLAKPGISGESDWNHRELPAKFEFPSKIPARVLNGPYNSSSSHLNHRFNQIFSELAVTSMAPSKQIEMILTDSRVRRVIQMTRGIQTVLGKGTSERRWSSNVRDWKVCGSNLR